MILLVCYNYDFEQTLTSFTSPEAAMADIVETFDVALDPGNPDIPAAVMDRYKEGDWKGFSVHALDPASATSIEISIEDVNAALASNHARLNFERKIAARLAA